MLCSRLKTAWNVSDQAIPGNTWIGLYIDDPCDGCDLDNRRLLWEWLDGTPYDHTVFHHWRNGSDEEEPSGKEPCARMNIRYDDRGWIAYSCTRDPYGFTCGYVCKKGTEFITH